MATLISIHRIFNSIVSQITQLGSVWKLVNSTSLNDMDMIRSRILRLGDIQETLTHCHVTENVRITQLFRKKALQFQCPTSANCTLHGSQAQAKQL